MSPFEPFDQAKRSHVCPDCDDTFASAAGLGSHRWYVHGVRSAKPRATRPGRSRANGKLTRSALQELLPGANDIILNRLANYIVTVDCPRALVVIGAHYGPRLVSRQYVGDVVRVAKEPCIVVELDQLAVLRNRLVAS